MPTPPPIPNVIQTTYTMFVGADTDAQVSLWFEYGGGAPSAAQLTTYCTAAAAQWITNISPIQSVVHELVKVTATDHTSPSSGQGFATAANTGTRSGAELPAGTAALFNMTIARRYRGGKPRIYLPAGVTTDLGSPQSWTTGFKTACDSAIAAYIAWHLANPPAPVSGYTHVNVSRFHGYNPPTTLPSGKVKQTSAYRTPPLIDLVTSVTLNPKVGSQRRRNLHST
jgi:hypothetical protein